MSEAMAAEGRYMSSLDTPKGLRERLGERNGLDERPTGSREVGEDAKAGEECARIMGGAVREPELDCERRWDLE
jgi:hypothetical protein